MNFYRWIQNGLDVDRRLENQSDFYYAAREEFNSLLRHGRQRTADAAILFYYLNRTGYNGLCRFNSRGEFNVPFGRYAKLSYRTSFSEFAEAFRGWEFTNTHFSTLRLHPDDFVYADPPYDVEFRQYSSGGFTWAEQVDLAIRLSSHQGPVVLANQATERIIDLYTSLGFSLEFLRGPRRISCNGDRSSASEVLATRNVR